jgi:hypothetical protein
VKNSEGKNAKKPASGKKVGAKKPAADAPKKRGRPAGVKNGEGKKAAAKKVTAKPATGKKIGKKAGKK